ncbi:MAG: hypothetical protein CVT88_05740 [Candidatus Altiarchaeales archaeon HGW-Altiarchaeales-1]|nr:MAG: hypothetical protein CVT88_05740 [Candidatus Altiarchaeales archaeon HGW-Altiarchaeales-1]
MLSLKENIEWKEKINVSTEGNVSSGYFKYTVLGIEKIGKVNCFRVEVLYGDENEEEKNIRELGMRKQIWVDTEKRILIKSQTYAGNLLLSETNLK